MCRITQTPAPTEIYEKQTQQYKDATKELDNTAIADKLKTVSWSRQSHPTGVVKPVSGPNIPTNHKSCVIKRTY